MIEKPLPKPKHKHRFVNSADALLAMMLGLAMFIGKIKGVPFGIVSVSVGGATMIAGFLILLDDINLLKGRWAWSGWILLLAALLSLMITKI